MTLQTIIDTALALPGAYKDWPFGPEILTLRAANSKIFCFVMKEEPLHITLKCDPMEAELLRQAFACVRPGYHMNKRHWNSLYLDENGILEEEVIRQLHNAYWLVVGNKKAITPLRP